MAWLALAAAAVGCATPSHVRTVETQVLVLRAEAARSDSVFAAELARIIRLQRQVLDSVLVTTRSVKAFQARYGSDVTDILTQLAKIGELAGLTGQELSAIKKQIEARNRGEPPEEELPDSGAEMGASAEEMYDAAKTQHDNKSYGTARTAFFAFLNEYPSHPKVPDALFFIAEGFEKGKPALPDSAIARFTAMQKKYPAHTRAATALYRVGLLYMAAGDKPKAKTAFEKVIADYPKSDEAALAKSRLIDLGKK